MSVRAVIYARYSDPRQNPASIRDQISVCRDLATRLSVDVVEIFTDAAISGAAAGNRPGYLDMMAAAKAGKFDLVIAEALDRLSRGQADTAVAFEDLRAQGVAIHTISEGLVDELHVGLKGTMNALFLRDLGAKTRRGQKGVIEEGRVIATPYGYDVVRKIGENGEIIVGLRKVNDDQAAVIRRIFADYVAGLSPQRIVRDLNAEGVPGAQGKGWCATRLNGSKGTGILRNETYRGVVVWGKTVARKDRVSGRRKVSQAPADKIVRVAREDLRIVSDDLWNRAAARLAVQSATRAQAAQFQRRPKRLLSGIVFCGCCGSLMSSTAGERIDGVFVGRLRCGARIQKGKSFCTNGRAPPTINVETRVLAAVRHRLLRPEAVDAAVREVHRLLTERAKNTGADRGRLERELNDTRRKAERLVDLVADGGVSGATVRDKLATLEARATALERELASLGDRDNVLVMHPAAAGYYRDLVQDLVDQLDGVGASAAADAAAREAFRRLIGQVRFIPGDKHGEYELEIIGELQRVLAFITGRSLEATSADQLGEYRISG